MTTTETRRQVMLLAWSFRREAAARAFSDCLRGAWRMVKASIKSAARFHAKAAANGGRVSYGSLVKAPLHGFASGSSGHRRSGITTSRLGA